MKELLQVRRPGLAIDFSMDLNDAFVPDRNARAYTKSQGSAEPEVVSVMYQVLKSGDTAIDGGANIGYFSLVMATMVGTSGKILAFEPGPNNIPKIKANVSMNRAKQIKVIEQPLWSKQEEVTLHMATDSGTHSLKPHDTFGSQVMEATTIDAWHASPKLIKLDIEGSEVEALIGGIDTISSHQPYVVCEINEWALNRFGRTVDDLRKYAKDTFGYDTFMLSKGIPYPSLVPPKSKIKTILSNTNVLLATVDMVAKAWPEFTHVE